MNKYDMTRMKTIRILCFSAALILVISTASVLVGVPPEKFSGDFAYDGEQVALKGKRLKFEVQKISFRGPNFKIAVQKGPGKYELSEREVRTYIGRLVDDPGSAVGGYLRPDNTFVGRFYLRGGESSKFDTAAKPVVAVGRNELAYDLYKFDRAVPSRDILRPGDMPAGVRSVCVGVEVVPSKFRRNPGKEDLVTQVETAFAQNNMIYMTCLKLMVLMDRVVVRDNPESDPYKAYSGSPVNVAMSVWLGEGTEPELQKLRDPFFKDTQAKYILVVNGGSSQGGRAAQGDLEGTVWRHEFGHCFGPGNQEGGGEDGRTIMVRFSEYSRFSSVQARVILDHMARDADRFEKVTLPTKLPIPPYASCDYVVCARDAGKVMIDVMANDHDFNDQQLRLVRHDAASIRGQPVTLSKGTGPDGRDQLVYAVSPERTGLDLFYYDIENTSGQLGTGVICLDLRNPGRVYDAGGAKTNGKRERTVWSEPGTPVGASMIAITKGQGAEWQVNAPRDGVYGLRFLYNLLMTEEVALEKKEIITKQKQAAKQKKTENAGAEADEGTPMSSRAQFPFGMRVIVNDTPLPESVLFYSSKFLNLWRPISVPRVALKQGINTVRIENPDHNTPVYLRSLTVTEGTDIRINFGNGKTAEGGLYAGDYIRDLGGLFGPHGNLQFGWLGAMLPKESFFVEKSPLVRFDLADAVVLSAGRTWETALPNGDYHVHAACGDNEGKTDVNTIEVEGKAVSGKSDGRFAYLEATVHVSDGRLTIRGAPGTGDVRLAFIVINDVGSVSAPPAPRN